MSENKQADINALGFGPSAEEMRNNFKHVEDLMKAFSRSHESMNLDPFNLGEAYSEWFTAVSKNPEKAVKAGMDFWQKSMQLNQQTWTNMLTGNGQEKADAVITEDKSDRRFKHDDWSENPVFDLIKQSYLMTSEYMRSLVSDVEGLDEQTSEKVKFFTERYLDAMSPTNFAATNPAVIEKIKETKGANLLHGLKNMLEDMEEGEGELKIRMTDTSAFTLGENVATTPGKVVFQNRMFQLIQYTPTTDTVLKRPLLIVPPWINKFYIMDLQAKNSLLKWLVEQGHTVFVMSWVNPDETYREVGFDDYVTEGVITAVDAVQQATGENEINAIGYCIGGSLLSTTLAYMKANGDDRIKSATFLTTMIDFEQPGELGVYIDEKQVSGLEQTMNEEGYLDGTKMAGAFNLLRANDLIWSFYINNYLLGNDPRPFDLLYWNSDSTRMTATMHSWYLRNFYMENKLCKPNGITIKNTPIDISTIDIPVCFVSTIDDHIAPWLSTYSGAQLFSGDTRFVLGGSGHIAGIINPPDAHKYGYRVTDDMPADPQAWADSAEAHEGSWWPNWNDWVRSLSANETVPARQQEEGGLDIIEDAPGTYVKCKMNDPTPVLEVTKLDPSRKPKTETKAEKVADPAPEAKRKVVASEQKTGQKSGKKATPKTASKQTQLDLKTEKSKQGQKLSNPKTTSKSKPKLVKDDLTVISGIGPKVQEMLNTLGIVTFEDMAQLSAAKISDMMAEVDIRNNRFDTTNWPKEAAKLAKK